MGEWQSLRASFAVTAPGFIGTTYVQVVTMLYVLPRDIAAAKGPGAQFEVVVVCGDICSVGTLSCAASILIFLPAVSSISLVEPTSEPR